MKKEEEGGCEERRDMRGWERRREGCEEKGGRRRMQWQTTYGNLTILLLALICSICVKCANIRGFVILVFVGANVWTVVTLLVSYFCVYIHMLCIRGQREPMVRRYVPSRHQSEWASQLQTCSASKRWNDQRDRETGTQLSKHKLNIYEWARFETWPLETATAEILHNNWSNIKLF